MNRLQLLIRTCWLVLLLASPILLVNGEYYDADAKGPRDPGNKNKNSNSRGGRNNIKIGRTRGEASDVRDKAAAANAKTGSKTKSVQANVESSDDYYYMTFDDILSSVGTVFDPSHVLTFNINPREKFCFYEEITEEEIAEAHLQKKSSIEGALFVSGGSNRDIQFEIYGPDADKIHNNKVTKEGGFSVPMSKEGTYEFCFSNQMSVRSTKKVTMALHFEKPKAAPEYLQTEDLLPIGVASDEVYNKLSMVNKELRFMKLRYSMQRSVQIKTLSVSTRFSILEGLAVVAVAIVQVLWIRHLVSDAKPILGR